MDRALTEYPTVRFHLGDRVRVSAGGCVQTGGAGRTWKRYVNPAGPNSDRLYHGLIEVPGATNGVERIANVLDRELVVTSAANAYPTFLRLGYEDNDLSDNGYWGHDDGTGDQCKDVGNAFVELTILRDSVAVASPGSAPITCPAATDAIDADQDGVVDICEQSLADKYAPVVIHANDEPNLPTSVDWFLSRTSLWFHDDKCNPDLKQGVMTGPTQSELRTYIHSGDCGATDTVFAGGTRSREKQRTFFLEDVAAQFRKGSLDSKDWVTYYHAYPNDLNGVTVQYWRFHAYNTGKKVAGVEIGFHGGDWEGVQVVLNQNLQPAAIRLLGHTDIETLLAPHWSALQWEGFHPVVFSEKGGHASRVAGAEGGIRQETWPGGRVRWPNGGVTETGRLVNIGEKTAPLNDNFFIQYSGLWGSSGKVYFSSGYWGPAYNETDMGSDGFITAWCAGMKSPARQQCYPTATSR